MRGNQRVNRNANQTRRECRKVGGIFTAVLAVWSVRLRFVRLSCGDEFKEIFCSYQNPHRLKFSSALPNCAHPASMFTPVSVTLQRVSLRFFFFYVGSCTTGENNQLVLPEEVGMTTRNMDLPAAVRMDVKQPVQVNPFFISKSLCAADQRLSSRNGSLSFRSCSFRKGKR